MLGDCCRNLAARFIDDEAEMSGSDSGDEGSQSELSGDFISYAGTQALAGIDGSVGPCRWAVTALDARGSGLLKPVWLLQPACRVPTGA